jgi:hypothetical protein
MKTLLEAYKQVHSKQRVDEGIEIPRAVLIGVIAFILYQGGLMFKKAQEFAEAYALRTKATDAQLADLATKSPEEIKRELEEVGIGSDKK